VIYTAHTYLQQVMRLLRAQKQELNNPADLLSYINIARREVAGRTQCIRRLTPISGPIAQLQITAGGSGYVSPQIAITPPDFPSGYGANPNGLQATAEIVEVGGVITSVVLTNGGDGYFQPIVTITDSAGIGSGAEVTATTVPINTLNEGQEVYNFSDIYVGAWPGVDSVYMIKSVSVVYTNYRYSLPMYAFSVYQAMIRQYPFQYQYVPSFSSQFGQGSGGSFYHYPLPSQTYQIEYDCFCLPLEMTMDNGIPEAIPQPWNDAVQFYAAQLAFQELGNFNSAKYYEQQFDKMTLGFSAQARPGRVTNPYGRY
jgi:hypothetical protein